MARILDRAAVGCTPLWPTGVRAVHYPTQSGFRHRDELPESCSLYHIGVALRGYKAAGLTSPR